MDMMTINQVEPIYVTFSVPEAQLTAIKKYMALGSLSVRARRRMRNRRRRTWRLTFVDNTVDVTTGTIKLKGTFPNCRSQIVARPVRSRDPAADHPANAVVVPNEAIQTGQNGRSCTLSSRTKLWNQRNV
jgi:multidrug efflux system membrane fusion protein